jgi:5-oxopent-3-ene-1,2,5-tricarboxylate decarboxylase/2-hydroxyhepta-2,4-diene-1,7-dioate isomerase
MAVGDLIEVEVSQLGRLGNRVVEGPVPRAAVGHQPTDSEAVRRVALGSDERLPPQLAKSA